MDFCVKSLTMYFVVFIGSFGYSQMRTVALTGQPVANMPGRTYQAFDFLSPYVSPVGEVIFNPQISGIERDEDHVILSEIGGSLHPLVIAGEAAPELGESVFFDRFFPVDFHSDGSMMMAASMFGPNAPPLSDNNGLWTINANGDVKTIAIEGQQAPGLPDGVIFDEFNTVSYGRDGTFVFRSMFRGNVNEGNNVSLWRVNRDGPLTKIAQSGDLVGGLPDSSRYTHLTFELETNDTGTLVNLAKAAQPGSATRDVIFTVDTNDVTNFLLSGDAAPEFPENVTFDRFFAPVINNNNEIAFQGIVAGAGFGDGNDEAIWYGPMDDLRVLARSADIAPGTNDGAVFREFNQISITDSGFAVFRSGLNGRNLDSFVRQGIWKVTQDGEILLVARRGSHAPGTSEDTVFSDNTSPPVINEAGQVLVRSWLLGPDVTRENNEGLWATNQSGELTLILRNGDTIDVDDGPGMDMRTIERFSFPGSNAFNDRGQIVFGALFSDGTSGVFVTDAVAVPESTSVTVVILAATVLFVMQRRRGRNHRHAR